MAEGRMDQVKEIIEEKFEMSVDSEKASQYQGLRKQQRTVRDIAGSIGGFFVLVSLIGIFFFEIWQPYLFIVMFLVFGVFLLRPFERPIAGKIDDLDLNVDRIPYHEFDNAIDAYNESDYGQVLSHLERIEDHLNDPVHQSNCFADRSATLLRYIQKVRDKSDSEEWIKNTFPEIAKILTFEVKEKRRNGERLDRLLEELEEPEGEISSEPLFEIYKESVRGMVTRNSIKIALSLAYAAIVVFVHLKVSSDLALLLAGLFAVFEFIQKNPT